MHRQHPDAQPGLGARAQPRLILRALCLSGEHREMETIPLHSILILVMFPGFGVGGSCEFGWQEMCSVWPPGQCQAEAMVLAWCKV